MLKHSSIPTVTTLQHQNNLIDRRRRAADRVIVAMRDENLALHCNHEKSGTHWWLSDGRPVQPEIAKLVTVNADIVSVDDGLFRNMPGQTYRFVSLNHGGENV
jgi:hypothetical protein